MLERGTHAGINCSKALADNTHPVKCHLSLPEQPLQQIRNRNCISTSKPRALLFHRGVLLFPLQTGLVM